VSPTRVRRGRWFSNRPAQFVLAAYGGLFALIGVAGLAQPAAGDRMRGAVFLAFGCWTTFRALRSSAVVMRATHVELRSIVRTRRIALGDIASVDVEVGRTGMNGFGREYLVIHLRDGSTLSFRELNSKPSTSSVTVVQDAARAIRRCARASNAR
jgi:hypothetical protein